MKLLLFLDSPLAPVFFVVFVFALYLGRALNSGPSVLPKPGNRLRRKLHGYCDGHLPAFRMVTGALLAPGPTEGPADPAPLPPAELEMYFAADASLDMVEAEVTDFFIEELGCRIRQVQKIQTHRLDARQLLVECDEYEGRYNVVISVCPVRQHFKLRMGRVFEVH